MFSEIFDKTLLPYLIDVGRVIFECSCIYAAYNIIRRQTGEGVDRLKWAMIGYICLRLIHVFMAIVDKMAAGMIGNIH